MTLHKRNYQQCHCIDNCLMGKSTTDNSICSIRPQCLLFSHNFYKFMSVHGISESASCKKKNLKKSYFHLCAGDKRQAQRDHIQISPGQRGDRTDPKKLPGHYQNIPGLYLSPHHEDGFTVRQHRRSSPSVRLHASVFVHSCLLC